jgi:hypothetical protein
LNKHSLADTSTTEETNLSTTGVRSQKIHDLDTSDKHFGGCGLFDEGRGIGVNGAQLDSLDGTSLIDGVASDVHDTAQSTWADGNHDGSTGIGGFATSDETLGTCSQKSASRFAVSEKDFVPSIAIHLTTLSPKCCW